jgi:hypothetical protein
MGADILFTRIAVTPEQIAASSLPSRPTTASDTRSRTRAEAAAAWNWTPSSLPCYGDGAGRHRAAHASHGVRQVNEAEAGEALASLTRTAIVQR